MNNEKHILERFGNGGGRSHLFCPRVIPHMSKATILLYTSQRQKHLLSNIWIIPCIVNHSYHRFFPSVLQQRKLIIAHGV